MCQSMARFYWWKSVSKRKNHVTLYWIWWLNSLKHTFPRNKYTGTIAGKIRAIVPEQLACWLMRLDHWCKLCWFQIDFNIDILNSRYIWVYFIVYVHVTSKLHDFNTIAFTWSDESSSSSSSLLAKG